MRLRFVATFLLFTFLALAGCSSTSSPENTATDFYTLIGDGKFDKAMKLIYIPEEAKAAADKTIIEGKFNIAMGEVKKQIDSHNGIKALKVTEAEISEDGTRASLSMLIHFKDGTESVEPVNLIKMEDGWKIGL